MAFLLLNAAAVNQATSDGWSPLHMAAFAGHIAIVDLLLENGARCDSVEKVGNTPMHYAAVWGFVEIVKKLLIKRSFPSAVNLSGRTPLHLAIREGHIDVVKLLLVYTDMSLKDKDGLSCLETALECNREEIAEICLAAEQSTTTTAGKH